MRRVLASAVLAAGVSLAGCSQEPPPVSQKVADYYNAAQTAKPVKTLQVPQTLDEVLPKLKGKDQEFVLTVLGDSTGVGPQAWVRQAVQRIADATRKTAVVRDWDPVKMAYGPSQQVGTYGAPKLIVWNGSASGKNADYASVNLQKMLVQKSDLIIINHGHNSPALFNATEHMKRLLMGVWSTASERAAIVVTAQNPRLDAGAKVDAEVVEMTRKLPDTYPKIRVLDAYKAFNATGNLEMLLADDGLHPNPEGHLVWAEAAVNFLGL